MENIDIKIADLNNERQAADFLEVLSSYAVDEMGGNEPLSQYVEDNLVDKLKAMPSSLVILAYVNDEVAGMANCLRSFSSFKAKQVMNIHDFAIKTQFRGRGLSKLLLDKVEEIANSEDCCKITLEVLEGNTRAKHVYQKFGFNGYELNPALGKAEYWEKPL